MTRPRVLVLLLALGVLAPLAGCAGSRTPASTAAPSVSSHENRRPASQEELHAYAERERQAAGLEDFKGGRRGIQTTTIVIILLAVIIVILLV